MTEEQKTETAPATAPETPKEPEIDLLQQFLTGFSKEISNRIGEMEKNYGEIIKQQQEQINALTKIVKEELPQKFSAEIEGLANETKNALVAVVKRVPKQDEWIAPNQAAVKPTEDTGIIGLINNGLKFIDKLTGSGNAGGGGVLNDFDKEILKTSKQIQLLSLRSMLKLSASQQGVALPEVAEHISVVP